jgi:aspartyl-tRNA(Asn)/glutamyl-tRNA(Gln) amidotransferase subunit C
MSLTIEQVQHIANLARLELDDDELARYRDQISTILDHFSQLQDLKTENIPPTSSASEEGSKLRLDQPRVGLELGDLLKNAPDTNSHQFRVPPIFK